MITLFQNKLNKKLDTYEPFVQLLKTFRQTDFSVEIEGAEGFFLAILLERLFRYAKSPFLIVTPTEQEAETLVRDLNIFTPRAYQFPWWKIGPYGGRLTPLNIAGRRMYQLVQMLDGEPFIAVTSLRAFLAPLPPPGFVAAKLRTLKPGQEFDPIELAKVLQRYRYLRVPRVSVPGEFALRGEVLDLFLPENEQAVRIVFEWDRIEEIRLFDPLTQASTGKLDDIRIFPVSEIVWDAQRQSRLKELLPNAQDLHVQIEEDGECPDEVFWFPAAFEPAASLADYLDDSATQFFLFDDRLVNMGESLVKEYGQLYREARIRRGPALKPQQLLHDFGELRQVHHRTFTVPVLRDNSARRIRFDYEGPRSFFGNIEYLKNEIENLLDSGYDLTICAETENQAGRITHLLKDLEVEVISSSISSGFSIPPMKLMIIQENEIFGRRRRPPASVKKARTRSIDTFVELNQGDLVVHVNYGIGRFKGIDRIKALGTERDYIKLEYAGEEHIFIPIEQVNLIQRYIGQEGRAPRLDTLGGKSWDRRKSRVRKSVEDLAEHLIDLYAKRRKAKGYAFPDDTDWQIEFEAEFPYEETEDQLRAIEDVKADMEKPLPMDRLVCGDVGYGKTEVAMRAAFKSVVSGRQVAFLAPTTILAEQHYENFIERFKRYPVRIDMISRFVQRSSQKEVLRRVREGETDILIGTHRILQKDVQFKSLGLMVVDEEQRFGVKDKERLKELKSSVDVLTLSATPIPRTLHMSLLKIRDMSLITTPPVDRRPIETHVQEFDEELVAKSIRHEMERGGQVFYLHNRVETLLQVRQFIERVVPESLIETAHGQMTAAQLEDVMHRFVHGAFQVLVATTIIENGIDIPNVNTIIIDRADMYGISQLYQLRGRVGRSDRPAYAYLFFPEKRALSEVAMKRLQIISDYTDLGSGFKIAMKDLEVRGTGNLLGRQQHGEILSVGFDMYLRLLDEAVAAMSEEEKEPETAPEVYLELDYSGYIPDTYIQDITEKMEIYKMIASIETDYDLERVYGELTDRFGPMPEEVQSLLAIAELRIVCKKLHIRSLKERRGKVFVEFGRVSIISPDRVLRLINESGGSVGLDARNPNVILMNTEAIGLKEKSEFIREKLQSLL